MFRQSSLDNGIIGDYLLLKAGKAMPADRISSSKADGMFPCFGGNGIRGYVDSYNYDGDYAIIGRQGALCGNVCLAQGKFYATEHAVVVTPKAIVDSTWLFFALNQMNLNQYARGVAQPGLAVNELEKLPFSVPDINKQIEFSIIAKQADKSKFSGLKSQFIEMLKGKAVNGTISDLVAPKIANVKKTYSHDDTIQYIDISSINAEDHSVSQITEYSVKDAPSRAQQCVKYGDLLVSTVRPINRNIAIVDKDLDNLVASTGFCVLRPNDGMLNYLLSIVLSDDYTDAMCDKANGGVYPAVNNGDVLNYQIHIPDDDLAKRASLVRQQADKSKQIAFSRAS